jgi:hypothetical protein
MHFLCHPDAPHAARIRRAGDRAEQLRFNELLP